MGSRTHLHSTCIRPCWGLWYRFINLVKLQKNRNCRCLRLHPINSVLRLEGAEVGHIVYLPWKGDCSNAIFISFPDQFRAGVPVWERFRIGIQMLAPQPEEGMWCHIHSGTDTQQDQTRRVLEVPLAETNRFRIENKKRLFMQMLLVRSYKDIFVL